MNIRTFIARAVEAATNGIESKAWLDSNRPRITAAERPAIDKQIVEAVAAHYEVEVKENANFKPGSGKYALDVERGHRAVKALSRARSFVFGPKKPATRAKQDWVAAVVKAASEKHTSAEVKKLIKALQSLA